MKITVKQWGNSAAIRIPAALLRAAQLQSGAVVDVREEDGRIVIRPAKVDEVKTGGNILKS